MARALGRCVDGISLAGKCNGIRLCLDLEAIDLVDILGIFESSNLNVGNILARSLVCQSCYRRKQLAYLDPKVRV
jgi:hypothetical protein